MELHVLTGQQLHKFFLMQTDLKNPLSWLSSMQWPAVVIGAFYLGRTIANLEKRIFQADKNLSDLVSIHFPAIHNALAEIRGLLGGRR